MIERRKIVEMWQRGEAVALATLIRVEGSSYRATGARILIAGDGSYVGSVSGGCLEAEIVRKAQWLVRDGARVERYSTLFDDTAEIPYGLGCGGTVDILIEPATTPEFTALMQAFAASLRGETRHVTTWAPDGSRPLARQIAGPDQTSIFRSGRWASDPLAEGVSERLDPPQRLLIFGAGDDAQPLVRMASLVGWTVDVIDSRSQWARISRFPEADRVLAIHELGQLQIMPDDAIVLMTHSYEQDRSWLEQVLPFQARYLGLLGSRHRSALLIAEAAKLLDWPLEQACERLFSPVGLDLGGDGAEAIALSVLAEVQALIHGKLGTSRRLSPDAVIEQIAQGGSSRYLQAQCAL